METIELTLTPHAERQARIAEVYAQRNKIKSWGPGYLVDTPQTLKWTDAQRKDADQQERLRVRPAPTGNAICFATSPDDARWIASRLNLAARAERWVNAHVAVTDDIPQIDSVWQHRNGNLYTVIGRTNEDAEDFAEYPVLVVYQGSNTKVWSRPLTDWHRSFTHYSGPRVRA